MKICKTTQDCQTLITSWQQHNIGFVPTMGNFHAGHLSLIKQARAHCDKVVVSIFVNPLQFNNQQDFATYPHSLEQDIEQINQYCDLLFCPDAHDIYPQDMNSQTKVLVPEISEQYCGHDRPGHFLGVTTIVNKLFNITRPNYAYFGEKDFQQLFIIKKMVADLCLPIKIIGLPTVRETDGLAMSSRNQRLSTKERQSAPALYDILKKTKNKIVQGNHDFTDLRQQAMTALANHNFKPEYIAITNAKTLDVADATDTHIAILAAAYLGQTRLIDNLHFELE